MEGITEQCSIDHPNFQLKKIVENSKAEVKSQKGQGSRLGQFQYKIWTKVINDFIKIEEAKLHIILE